MSVKFILAYSEREDKGQVQNHEEFIWELYPPIKEVDKKIWAHMRSCLRAEKLCASKITETKEIIHVHFCAQICVNDHGTHLFLDLYQYSFMYYAGCSVRLAYYLRVSYRFRACDVLGTDAYCFPG